MDRNKNDINTSCNWKIRLIDMSHESNLVGSCSNAASVVGSSHTPACCLSKSIEWVEYGKTIPTVCQIYVKPKNVRCIRGGQSAVPWKYNGNLTEAYASVIVYSCANEAGFTCSRTYVYGLMNLCSFMN